MHPSGEQYELSHGDQSAVVVEVGGGVRRYDVADAPVLDGYPVDQLVTGARGQPLVPWPNRLHYGRYTWDGEEHQVPLDEPEQANAIHGLTRWRSFAPRERTASSVTMGLLLRPQPGYPFTLDLTVQYELSDGGLTVTTRALNLGERDAPFGQGAHPYLSAAPGLVDDCTVHLAAGTYLPTGPAQIPIGPAPVEGTPYDFRQPVRLRHQQVDVAFTDLTRDADGRAWVVLRGPGRTVALWADQAYPYLELFTGDTLPDRRRQGLGVEPMSCPPNALQTGVDVRRLGPGETFTGSWGVTVVS